MKPFYIWAGGKTRLLKHYGPVWPTVLPSTYVEPFFGGGAVYGWLAGTGSLPDSAVIGDVNTELMGLLASVRNDHDAFLTQVDAVIDPYLQLTDKALRKEFYYALRRSYWQAPDPATLFVLMRLGFNGIWQTCKESHGLFATPAGLLAQTHRDQIYRREDIAAWSAALAGASVNACPYDRLDFSPENALIYLDPPYRDSFTSYGTGFNDDDQRALVAWARAQHEAGATVLLANRHVDDDPFFESLLSDVATFHYFDVTYTAGRRKKVEGGFEAKRAREFLAVLGKR